MQNHENSHWPCSGVEQGQYDFLKSLSGLFFQSEKPVGADRCLELNGNHSLLGVFVFPQFLQSSHLTRLLSLICWFAFSGCLSQRFLTRVQRNISFVLFICSCAESSHCVLGQVLLLPGLSCPGALQGKAGSARNVTRQQQRVGSTPQDLLGWVHGWEQGVDTAFEEGQRAKAVQDLAWWSFVAAPQMKSVCSPVPSS